MPNYEKEISEITLFIGTVDGKPKTVSLSDYPTVVAQLSALLRRVELEGKLFALDNETLWQYQRKCNAGEASKATRNWLVSLMERNITKYKAELKALTRGGSDE